MGDGRYCLLINQCRKFVFSIHFARNLLQQFGRQAVYFFIKIVDVAVHIVMGKGFSECQGIPLAVVARNADLPLQLLLRGTEL